MKVSPTEAAEIAGVTRKTLYADMNKGHLSFEVTDKKKRLIQVAELERVYGKQMSDKKESEGNTAIKVNTANGNTNAADSDTATLREKLENLEKERLREREQLTDQIDHLREMLKSEQEERRKITALVTDQRQDKESRGGEQDKKLQALETTIEELKKQNRRILVEMQQKKQDGFWSRLLGPKPRSKTA
jgi:chromosome segregation ATPase